MGIVFLIVGIFAVAIGVRGQAGEAGKLLASEFTGSNSYVQWLAAILILGAIGIWKPARPAANAMIGLVILAIFIRRGQGFFDQFNSAITSATAAPRQAVATASGTPSAAGSSAPTGSQSPPASGPTSIGDWIGALEHMFGIAPTDPGGKAILNTIPSLPSFTMPALQGGDVMPLTPGVTL